MASRRSKPRSTGSRGRPRCTSASAMPHLIHERPEGYSFLPELASSAVKQISIETAQSNLDTKVLESLPGKTIILGVLDLSTHAVEEPETVAARIRKALPTCRAERVIVAPDCGLKYLPREVAFGKMKAMAEGAKIVRDELGVTAWPSGPRIPAACRGPSYLLDLMLARESGEDIADETLDSGDRRGDRTRRRSGRCRPASPSSATARCRSRATPPTSSTASPASAARPGSTSSRTSRSSPAPRPRCSATRAARSAPPPPAPARSRSSTWTPRARMPSGWSASRRATRPSCRPPVPALPRCSSPTRTTPATRNTSSPSPRGCATNTRPSPMPASPCRSIVPTSPWAATCSSPTSASRNSASASA